jgi:hypothetical protein
MVYMIDLLIWWLLAFKNFEKFRVAASSIDIMQRDVY